MAILFQTSFGDLDAWLGALTSLLPDDEFRIWPDAGDPADIEFVIGWQIPVPEIKKYENAQALLVMGAGVNHLRPVEDLPDIPIVRLVDEAVASDMAAYVAHWVLHFHRHMHRYDQQQSERTWRRHVYVPPGEFTVGILGLGNIGTYVADAAMGLGYSVRGWSRSGRTHPGVESFDADGLDAFLAGTNALVNVLPVTPETTNLVDADALAQLPSGAVVINVGRAATFDHAALVAALDAGHLDAAVLDVFEDEPLDASNPLWSHPLVRVTPHISGSTFPRSAAKYIAANIKRVRAGEAPFPVFDRERGY